jgi:hypothetical protein
MTESEFSDAVVDLAHTFGWTVAAFRPARTQHGWRTPVRYDAKGWPDLTLVGGPHDQILFAELKAGHNRPDPDQQQWLDRLNRCARAFVWWPTDSDRIATVLSAGRVTEWSLT